MKFASKLVVGATMAMGVIAPAHAHHGGPHATDASPLTVMAALMLLTGAVWLGEHVAQRIRNH